MKCQPYFPGKVRKCHQFVICWLCASIFSRRQIDDIFLIFPRKQNLKFYANRQFAWDVKSCFLGKIRKIFQNAVCWKFYPECWALKCTWSYTRIESSGLSRDIRKKRWHGSKWHKSPFSAFISLELDPKLKWSLFARGFRKAAKLIISKRKSIAFIVLLLKWRRFEFQN